MAGAGNPDLFVTSWGWDETDGVKRRKWLVGVQETVPMMLLLSPDIGAIEATELGA